MLSRSLALGLLAAGCVAAAGGGAYVAVRQNAVEPAPAPAVAAEAAPQATAQQPVSETEALVAPATTAADVAVEREPVEPRATAADRAPAAGASEGARASRTSRRTERTPRAARSVPPAAGRATAPPLEQAPSPRDSAPLPPTVAVESHAEPPRYVEPQPAPEPRFEEVTVPASAVIGLQIESAVSSERAQVEDRVSARVTRDVMAGGRVAIPAGSRVLGSVTLVEKGGKVRERARLGIRFHTLVLADGSEVSLRTEPIIREGESPAGDSSRKIGGAAVGGAILGAILGGGKGAVIGGATGAAGGTAAVMAGDRHPAMLPSGTIVTVRLSSPVDVQIEAR